MVIRKASNDISNNLDFIIRTGAQELLEGMTNAKKFDPANPFTNYDEKNAYFNTANNACMYSLWANQLYDLSERYYSIMLNEIKAYEKSKNTNFNKGMAYANLGVSQIAQGKIDEGFANILKSQIEDEPYLKMDTSKSVFNSPLYTQFEDADKNYLLKHSTLYATEENATIDKPFLDKLITALDTDSHILFISLIEKLRRHMDVLADKDNRFSRLQIFLCLQDLCLATEHAIKKKNTINGTIKPLLDTLFSAASGRDRVWKTEFDTRYQLAKAEDEQTFENNLKEILRITNTKTRRLLVFCSIRNFSAHNLDVSSDWVYQQNMPLLLDNIISAVLFLSNSGCI